VNKQVTLFGITIHNISMGEALAEIERLIKQNGKSLVVTPNAQHINIISKDEELRKLYGEAALVLTDSVPLLWAAKILGRPMKERVAGSDIFPAFCKVASQKNYKIFLLGAEPGIAKKASSILQNQNPGLNIVGTYSPLLGFEQDHKENEKIINLVNRAQPDVLFVGLGSPKGEKWAWTHKGEINSSVIICVGAAFDFVAGKSKRAPLWMQKSGLEWFHRLSQEPRRLWKRYLIGNSYFIWLVFKESFQKRFRKKGL
jgi:N-acetylglucosaminyldiphosphoundecaprenol N-acetyl-beta-D-mannosaminyltransferase